jgi:hypothetical protein
MIITGEGSNMVFGGRESFIIEEFNKPLSEG